MKVIIKHTCRKSNDSLERYNDNKLEKTIRQTTRKYERKAARYWDKKSELIYG